MTKFTNMAIGVDIPSMTAMVNGPASLQIKSIRRICELRTNVTVEFVDDTGGWTYYSAKKISPTHHGGPAHCPEQQEQPEKKVSVVIQIRSGSLNLPSLAQSRQNS